MTLHKTIRSNAIRMAVLGVSVIAVSACTDFGPYPIATGYKYQQEEYKSAAGPEPVIEKYTRRSRPEAEPTVQQQPAPMTGRQWNMAANELVSRLVQNLGQPAEPVYIANPASPEEKHFAMALGQALRTHNIPTADRNAGAPFGMEYKVMVIDVGQPDRRMLSIQLINQGKLIHEESGIYTVGMMHKTDSGGHPPMHGDHTSEMSAPDNAPVSIAP